MVGRPGLLKKVDIMANTSATPATVAPTATSTTGTGVGGTTTIDDSVVAKVVGLAVRDIPGVYGLGGGVARVLGAVRDAVGSTDLTQGVSVEVGETEVAVDVSLVAEYPVPLGQIADAVRAAAATAVEELVGMRIAEVNVTISDVHVPGDDETAEPAEPRVR